MSWQKMKDKQYAIDHPSKRKLAMIALRKVMIQHGFRLESAFNYDTQEHTDLCFVFIDENIRSVYLTGGTESNLGSLIDHMD